MKTKPVLLHEIRTNKNALTRAEGEGDAKKIVGYFNVFSTLSEPIYGWMKEEIQPGAFKNSLAGKHGRDDIAALNNHDSSMVLGSTKAGTYTLKEDKTGLYGEIDPPDTSYARDLMVSLERGDINSASFGFFYKTVTWRLQDDWDVCEVRDLDLVEGTVCKFPAFRATEIGIRSFLKTSKDIEAEALPMLCRAYNRLENKLDMTQDDKSNILQYRSILHSLLPEESKNTLAILAPERTTLSVRALQTWIDATDLSVID